MVSFRNRFSFKLKDFNIAITVIKVHFISTARGREREQHSFFHILQKNEFYFARWAVLIIGIH